MVKIVPRLFIGIVFFSLIIGFFLADSFHIVQADGDTSLPAQMNKEFIPNRISVGGTSTLNIIVFNPNTFPLTLSTSPASLSDTLPSGMTFADPVNATTTCGGTVSITGTTVSLIGGTVPAKSGLVFGTCTVSVNVTSLTPTTYINTIPANNLKATDPTGTITVTNTTPASNNLLVDPVQPPSLNKTIADATRYVGQTTTLTINIKNNDTNYSLTQVSLTDTLPTNLVIASATVTKTNCGTPSITGPSGNPLAVNDTAVTMTGATIAPNTTCSVRVTIVSSVAAAYLNTIPARAIQSQQNVTNTSAATAPVNYQSLGATKTFSPSMFQAGGYSDFTITLNNPSSTAYTGITFTDTLPTGLSFYGAPLSPQCNGTVTYDATHLYLVGGSIPAGTPASPQSCTIKARVTSTYAGKFTNSIPPYGIVTDQKVTNLTAISGNVTVYTAGNGITEASKSFSPSTIGISGESTLTISFRAPADTDLTNFSLLDVFPEGIQVSSLHLSPISGCQGGVFSPAVGDTRVLYSGGIVLKGTVCTLKVNVTSTKEGVFQNIISPVNISNAEGQNVSSSFSATLTVTGIGVKKSFTPPTVNSGGISTMMIQLTNTNTVPLENVKFTDTLPSGIKFASTPNLVNSCGSTSVTLDSGSPNKLIMNGGIVPAQVGSVAGICTVYVDVVGSSTGTNTLAASSVTGDVTVGGATSTISNISPESTTLTVSPLSINVVKAFSPVNVTGGSSSKLTVTLSNPTTALLTGITFTDHLPYDDSDPDKRGIKVAFPSHASVGTCGGTITANSGDTSFTFSGGSLAAKSSCDVSIDVTMNKADNLTNVIHSHDVTTTNGATNENEASATLTNLAGASVTKAFVNSTITSGVGNHSDLVITINNTSNFPLTGLGLVDVLPSGMDPDGGITTPQCGGGTVAYDSSTRKLTLTDGSLSDGGSCTITVGVTAPTAGTYENCIEAGVLQNDHSASNERTCETLTVMQGLIPPSITKTFSPNPVAVNATSGLTFTITNPNATALTGVQFTDTFPSTLVVASTPNSSQCNGTVTTTANSITLTGGTIPASKSCTVTVGTKSADAGEYHNESGEVSSTNGGIGNKAASTLTVAAPPSITKSFTDSTITRGYTSRLQFIITNPAENTIPLTGVNFTDELPSGLLVASSPNATMSGCGSASFSPTGGSTSLSFSGGTIQVSPGNVCTVGVDIYAPNGGVYTNTSSKVSSLEAGTSKDPAIAVLTVNGVGLSLQKSTSTNNFKMAGDSITYDYKLTNTGTAELYGPFMISDNKIGAAFECVGTSPLAPSGEITCSHAYTVTAGDISAKSVTNTATATALDGPVSGATVTSNTSSVTVPLARLTIDKTTSSTGYTSAGATLNYSYTLTNTGKVNLYPPIQVSDDHINGGTAFNCGSQTVIPPDGVTTCSKSYTVLTADVTAGFVTNTAYATALDASSGGAVVTSNNDSVTLYRIVAPVISKSFSPNPIAVGSTSQLTFKITNPNTTVSLTGLAFSDTYPSGITTVTDATSSQCGGTATSLSGATSLSFTGGSLIPGGNCTITVLITASQPKNYVNTSGSVSASNGGTGNKATDTLTVLDAPVITKSFSPTTILENGTSTLQLNISNPAANTAALTNVAFTDNFPAGLKVQNPPNITITNCGTPVFSPIAGDTSLNFNGGSIAVGGTCTLTVDVTAPYGIYNNFTSPVSTSNGGTGVKSNTATLTVNQAVDLSITKTDNRLAVNRGEDISYTIEVDNAGPSTAVNAHVYDIFPSSLTGISWTCAPDTGAACTASGTGNISDVVTIPVAGKLVYTVIAHVGSSVTTSVANTAAVVAPAGVVDLDDTNNSSTDSDGLNLLIMDKTSSQSTYKTLGENISYNYKLTNIGTSTLYGPFSVADDKTTVTCPPTPVSLAPADTVTCTATYTITQDDLDNGSLTNNAYATGSDPDGDVVTSATDTLTIPSSQDQKITLVKSVVSGDPYIHVGDSTKYSYVLSNTGNVTLTGGGSSGEFTVTDDKATVTCPLTITKLAPTETVTCSATYTITSGDITAQSVTNTAQGHGKFGTSTINSNKDTATIHIKRGQITGVVYLDQNVNQTHESTETPISGVTIDIYDATGTTLLTTLTSNVSGSFSYTNLLPGTFVVVEHDPLGYISTTPNSLTVVVAPDGTAEADFGEYRATSSANNFIRGKVYFDANKNGKMEKTESILSGVTIELYDASNALVASTVTTTTGTFEFQKQPAGVFTVVETNPTGYASSTLDHVGVTLTSGSVGYAEFGDFLGAADPVDPAVQIVGSPTNARVNDTVLFSVTVGNNGLTDASDVVIKDTLPDFLDLVQVMVYPDNKHPVHISGQTFTVDIGTVTPTDVFTITEVTKVNSLGVPPGGLNTVSLTTTSMPEPAFNDTDDARVSIYYLDSADMPETGFAPDRLTLLPEMPEGLYHALTDMTLEIPTIHMKSEIVGLAMQDNRWDVSWLGDRVAYLEETAFPTWNGNSLITGHVYKSDGTPGPFSQLNQLRYGDVVNIHVAGLIYHFEVRNVDTIKPDDLAAAMKHEDKPWLSLMTCQGYDAASGEYRSRLLVRAVLMSLDKK